jgi:hypothetical protein
MNYGINICLLGEEVQALIDKKEKFDLAIIDIVLPAENLKKFELVDCQETGLRLMESMIENDICHRFYVITMVKKLRARVKQLCKGRAVYKFEDKLSYEPEGFAANVAKLIVESVPVHTIENG